MLGHAEPGGEPAQQRTHPHRRHDLQLTGAHRLPLGRAHDRAPAQPQLAATGLGTMPGGERLENGDGLHGRWRCHPLVGSTVILGLALEDGATITVIASSPRC